MAEIAAALNGEVSIGYGTWEVVGLLVGRPHERVGDERADVSPFVPEHLPVDSPTIAFFDLLSLWYGHIYPKQPLC